MERLNYFYQITKIHIKSKHFYCYHQWFYYLLDQELITARMEEEQTDENSKERTVIETARTESEELKVPKEDTEADDQTQLRLLLFPGQIAKISSMVALLTQQRDLCIRLQEKIDNGATNLQTDFIWLSQLIYKIEEDSVKMQVY